jgi:hypothetical protein
MVTALAVSTGAARADENRIAIESYVGPRPADVAPAMAHFRAALAQHRFTTEPAELKRQLDAHMVSPGISDLRFTTQAFSKQVERGLNAVVDEQYELAVRNLAAALENASRNPLVLARDPKSREARLEALIFIARACKHLGKTAARDQAMTEVIRSYPDKVITAKKYGPDAEEIYKAVKRSVDRGDRGQLSVEVTDPDAVVYVDETARGRGKTSLGDLLPGPHRVLVDPPSGESRQFTVEVLAKQHTHLKVDWDVASVLVTGDWVGFQLPTVKDREREGLLATRLASSYTSAVMIAVITAARVDRRLVVSGTVYAVGTGTAWRNGAVELTGRGDNKRLEQLAAYLGFQSIGDDVTPIERTSREAKPTRNAAPAPLPTTRPTAQSDMPRPAPPATTRPAPSAPLQPASATPPRPTPPTATQAPTRTPRPARPSSTPSSR